MTKYRLFLKSLTKDDVEIVEVLPTDKAFTQSREFNSKDEAVNYVISNSSVYIIREEKETEPEPQQT
jgi:hypothetical protein